MNISKPKSPCRRDCPFRDAFCKLDCEEYMEYEEKYKLYNDEKERRRKVDEPIVNYRKDIMTKRKMLDKRRRQNGK